MDVEQPTSAQQTPTKKSFKERSKENQSNKGGLIVLIVAIAIIVGLVVIISGGAKAKYQAESTGFAVVDPATVSVSFKVTNTDKADGKPSCTINAQDDSAHYTGTNVAQLDTVKAGATANSADTVTVTGQGAQYITKADVSCN